MRTVALVPIKLNNERLPGKNTKCFTNGKPLIHYILETLCDIPQIDECYVYCSDELIKKYLPNKINFLKRDPYYDLSTTPFNEILTSFADLVDADIYVLTHATAPFVSKQSIVSGIEQVKSGNYDSACSVLKLQEFIWKDGHPINYDITQIPRTQDLPSYYIETCGLYVYTHQLICKKKRRIGDKPYLVEVSKIEAWDINEPMDFLIADAILKDIKNDGVSYE